MMFRNITSDDITSNWSQVTNQTVVYSVISDILNCFSVVLAVVGVVAGCFVINVVRQLNDDELRSRFSVLCVLICDVILAFSNLSEIIYVLPLIDPDRFTHLLCPFVYFNVTVSGLFTISLVLSLLCLALDQIFATFKPLHFRTSEGKKRRVVYGTITFIPVILTLTILIYSTWTVVETEAKVNCEVVLYSTSYLLQFVVICVIPVAVSTPAIYAVVLWKISRQRCVHSENPLENIQNRRLVVSFLLLSASYFLLWMPTLAYFSICYFSSEGCWETDTVDVTLIVHNIFMLNYVIDPITCAVRMEPIKMRVIRIFKRR